MRSANAAPDRSASARRVHAGDAEALRDRPGIEASRRLGHHHVDDAGGARRLPEQGDADPGRRRTQRCCGEPRRAPPPCRAGRSCPKRAAADSCRQRRVRHETERPQTVVEGDQHDAMTRQVATHEHRVAASALLKGAAVKPDHDRPARVGRRRRAPDVEVQAVFAHRLRARVLGVDRAGRAAGLQALRGQRAGRPHAAPGLDRLRRPPAQRPQRRRRVGNAKKGANAALRVVPADEPPAVDGDDR